MQGFGMIGGLQRQRGSEHSGAIWMRARWVEECLAEVDSLGNRNSSRCILGRETHQIVFNYRKPSEVENDDLSC